MDPITSAIILGIVGNFATEGIKAAYNAFHNAFVSKHGNNSGLVEAINGLKANPDSKSRQGVIEEEVVKSKAKDDVQLVQLAQKVIDLVKEQPGGQQVITQNVSHVNNAATSGTGNASIGNINESRL